MKISRGTKCFSGFHGSECEGAFPKNFLKWVLENWPGQKRCHLCSGMVQDNETFKVDIRPEVKPDLVADATKTGLPSAFFDWVMIDPPYTRELAQKLYKTGEQFHCISDFTKEAARLTKPGGYVLTLSYEVPLTVPGCELVACWGIYTCPLTSFMRCFSVWKKEGAFAPREKVTK